MINLEWFRSFRSVYITHSVSQASELLNISQPTVSQHIAALENMLGKKLFERKSKGVLPTADGRQLNNLISGPIEALEIAELSLIKSDSILQSIISIGISEHMYKSFLSAQIHDLGEKVHVRFGQRTDLIAEVERGNLLHAIIPGDITSFDLHCETILEQDMLLVASPNIDLNEFEELYKQDKAKAENWLYQHKWYAHDNNNNFIKGYWLHMFNKKRPTLIADYVIPNEHEALYQLSQGDGLCVSLNTSAQPFIKNNKLKTCNIRQINIRKLSLISNKKKADPEFTSQLLLKLKSNMDVSTLCV